MQLISVEQLAKYENIVMQGEIVCNEQFLTGYPTLFSVKFVNETCILLLHDGKNQDLYRLKAFTDHKLTAA